ncbi:MAG: HlyD family efflux transporter periplasmic adaptor subunit [Solirubrobacteraceae bacterium]
MRNSWYLIALAVLGVVVVGAAVLEVGPPTSTARTSREVVTAEKGVVQSTVSGTGNVEPGTDVEANFQASGTLQHLYASVGEHVVKGQLLATLDPTSAELTLSQAQENLTSAEDQLTSAEDATTTTTTTSYDSTGSSGEFVSDSHNSTTTSGQTQTTGRGTTSTPTTTSGSSGRSRTSGSSSGSSEGSSTGSGTSAGSGSSGTGSSGSSKSSTSSSGSSGSSAETPTEKAANVASAQASVDSAEASVHSAQTALDQTHLYAPASGTVVSVASISPGDTVTSGSSSSSASSSSGSGSSGTSTTGSSGSGSGSSGSTSAGSLGGSSSSSSSSSSGVVEIVNASKMTMTVAFSESDVSKVKVGQPATVTLEALSDVELGAHVSSISSLGTTSDSVVSYDATLTLDQHDSQVKPGMSASASVVTGQAQGVTLPNSAVPGTSSVSSVNVLKNGKTAATPVVVGVRGDSRTQIVSGLSAGQQVVVTTTLPSLGTSTSSSGSSGSSGTLGGSGLGGGASRFLGGGGFAGGGAGFAGRFGGGAGAAPGGGG